MSIEAIIGLAFVVVAVVFLLRQGVVMNYDPKEHDRFPYRRR